MRRVALLSLGCKVNQAEWQELEAALRQRGYQIVGLSEQPELCIVNTCTVTAKSDYQSRQLIRRAHRSGAKVIATGCYSQLNPSIVKSLAPQVEVVSNENKFNIIKMLDEKTSCNTLNYSLIQGRSRLFLKIQDGCNWRCTYCLIPRARGRPRSMPPEEVIRRLRQAHEAGYTEVVLTGIHLGLYGADRGESLYGLLRRALKETGIRRIRLSSLELGELQGGLLELMHSGRLCRHLHVPLQSGSDRVLALMRRPYRAQEFVDKVGELASKVAGLALGTDVIVGFPTEREEDFQATYQVLKALPLSYVHVFPFSARPGTEASAMVPKVAPEEVKERVAALRTLAQVKREAFLGAQVGQVLEAVVLRAEGEGFLGLTDNYAQVLLASEQPLRCRGTVNAAIKGHNRQWLLAEAVS
jgi:threonylcarbamoyladenosine tRNA methylthiotransferase MtaB